MSFDADQQLRYNIRSNPHGLIYPVILATLNQNVQLPVENHFALSGSYICQAEEGIMGNNVTAGANSIVLDTDFPPLRSSLCAIEAQEGITKPVIIEDDIFIDMNCLIG